MEVPTILGAKLGAPSLDIEVRWVVGSGGCHQFHWCCSGHGLFVSVQKIIIIRCTQIRTARYYKIVQIVRTI